MPSRTAQIAIRLASGPLTPAQLIEFVGTSQPSLSRALAEMGDAIVRIGAARSIQYALRDSLRGVPEIPVYRVDAQAHIHPLGTLVPVRPQGFVMRRHDGKTLHSDGLPWWLFDMRPQGYLGRAHAARHGHSLGLPQRLSDWTDTHVLQALLAHGHDAVGNLLLGEAARSQYLQTPEPAPLPEAARTSHYPLLAQQAAQGELPGSSAGGEQPKFTAYAATPAGPRHLIVKFSEAEPGPVSERWRDLLLAEHLALQTLREAGIAASGTHIIDSGGQRFLEVERFDRHGPLGRRGLFSLAALDAEFVGTGTGGWPAITGQLASAGHVQKQAVEGAQILWAFGSLTGNTDMHNGNLSFQPAQEEQGRPYTLAPAYDMSPMAFAPRSGGGLPDSLREVSLDAAVPNPVWRLAQTLARAFLEKMQAHAGFSQRFSPCIAALQRHLDNAGAQIDRLG